MRDIERQEIKIAADAVVFTVLSGELHLLLIKRKNPPFQGKWAFPGGFVKNEEELEGAVLRELEEETGVKDIFLKQIGTYGKIGRDPRGRIISIAFLALIDAERFRLQARTDALEAQWIPVSEAKGLAFDHDIILRNALAELRFEIQTTNIAAQILPEKFTLSQLQQLYESVLGMALDKRNFRKKIRELGILRETKETRMEGAHRPAKLYRFVVGEYGSLSERMQVLL